MSCWNEPTGFHVFVLSWISLIITSIAGIGGVIAYYKLDSTLILVYGLENLVDCVSSAIVLWRFYLPPKSEAAEEARLLSREMRANVAICFVLVVLGFGTILTASEDFAAGKEEMENLDSLYYVSIFSVLVFGTMAFFKLRYADRLNSKSLKKDGICSAMGAVLAASLFMNTALAKASKGDLWWLDPFVALTCGIGSFIYGLKGIYKTYVRDGVPVFSCSWWLYSGDREADKGDLEMRHPGGANGSLPNMAPPSSAEASAAGSAPYGPTSTRMDQDEEIHIGDDAVDEIVLT
jgi:hypothetical protein